MHKEPVRVAAIVAGILVAASTALLALDAGQTIYFALGQALAYLGLVVGGGEIARTQTTPFHPGQEPENAETTRHDTEPAEEAPERIGARSGEGDNSYP